MAYDDNQVQIIGNLGQDAETRHTASGHTITTINIGVYAGKDKPKTWVKVKKWGDIDESTMRGLVTGTRVTVNGYISPCEAWISKESKEAKGATVITAESISITPWEDRGSSGSNASKPANATYRKVAPAIPAQPALNDSQDTGRSIDDYDDIPF
jgi:single-stranded DNA-binding protein